MNLRDIDIAILCGGKGTRVADYLGDTPKVLASIGGRPYLDWLIDRLKRYEAKRIVLCAGHLADKIKAWIEDRDADGIEIVLSLEPVQEGTGSAIRHARQHLLSPQVMVINGDTITNADLSEFVKWHFHGPISILEGRKYPNTIYRSAGHYLMSQEILDDMILKKAKSLEDFVHTRKDRKILRSGVYYDIGTPGALRHAPFFFENMLEVA